MLHFHHILFIVQELLEQLENVRQQLQERKSTRNFNIHNPIVNSPAASIVNSPAYSRATGPNIRPLSAIRPSQRFLF